MTKTRTETLPGRPPSQPGASSTIGPAAEEDRLCYRKPTLVNFGRIDQVTLGSGGSCTDGVNFDKALTGSGKCP